MTSPFQRFSRPADAGLPPVPDMPIALIAPVRVTPVQDTAAAPAANGHEGEQARADVPAVVADEVRTEASVHKMAVVVGHSSQQFANLLTGVTGTITEKGFQIDPMYSRVAYLFQLMEDGGAAAEAGVGEFNVGTVLTELTFENAQQAKALQLELLERQAATWDRLYVQMTPTHVAASDMARRMLDNERRRTAEGVKAVIADSGMHDFYVPIKHEAVAQQLDADVRYGDRQTLVDAAEPISLTICMDREREVLAEAPLVDLTMPLAPELTTHDGAVNLEMSSWIKVRAANAADAQAVFAKLLELRTSMRDPIDATRITDGTIDRFELTPRVTDDEDEDEGNSYYDSDR
jgi:hypothetical protein